MMGDFTRTGRRDLSGLLNDGVNSLARMYTSTFSDWFSQAVIDYTLGNRTISVFSEFLNKLQSSDPRDLIRLGKIRAEAIGDSVSRCLSEGERLLKGWTLFAPEELNVRIGDKFEEKVLLLSYDYTLEKVKRYTRVPLGDVIGISKEEASRDPIQNAGFVVSWLNNNQVTRVTNYSVRNRIEVKRPSVNAIGGGMNGNMISATATQLKRLSMTLGPKRGANMVKVADAEETEEKDDDVSFAAFKILPIDPARVRRATSMGGGEEYTEGADELEGAQNCKEAVEMVVDSIRKACEDVGVAEAEFLKDEDVVGLAEAQRMTSMYAKMEYGVKRLLWLGG
ncbi:hypothetical protein D9758_000704 [Tetrapyrgos nigripes]|uniref:Inositol phosphatase domain-containing protein n=1 Tax=Tetrapyrgos nigripes TaxID=182062 RepID=A0A8H5LY70_9AGAR|nr:hypothetical protein D9758_000704 [Tetrapyrgos nigripes]